MIWPATLSSACTGIRFGIRRCAASGLYGRIGKNQYRFWITRTAAASFVTVVGGIVLFLLYWKKVLKQIKNWNDGSWRASRQDGSDGHSASLVRPQILYLTVAADDGGLPQRPVEVTDFGCSGLPELITTYLKIQPWKETNMLPQQVVNQGSAQAGAGSREWGRY
jgi:uncharacterized protein YjeT (DUF2065 family)